MLKIIENILDSDYMQGIKKLQRSKKAKTLFILASLTVLVGTLFYHKAEGWSMLDSLYFSVVTLTTIGYGDLSPHTVIGKWFTIIYIFLGIGIILGFIEHATHSILRKYRRKVKAETVADIVEKIDDKNKKKKK